MTTDAHFAISLQHAVDGAGGKDKLRLYEFANGPLSTISIPAKAQADLIPGLNPMLLYAEGELKNFGLVRTEEQVDAKVHLIAGWGKVDLAARLWTVYDEGNL